MARGRHRRCSDVQANAIFRRHCSDFQFHCVRAWQRGSALVWRPLAWRLARWLGLGSRFRAWTWARLWLGLELSLRVLPWTILLRDSSAAGLRLGTHTRLAQRTLGIPSGVALLVNKSPPSRRACCVSFKYPRYFHSRTSTKCPAIAAAAAIAGETRCVRPL